MVGAIGELIDNVDEHSEHPESGFVAYHAAANAFEVVVADGGVGVLNSLRRNPAYASVNNSGDALLEATRDGVSGSTLLKRGYGLSTLFRSLAGQNGDIRFRSGDHALHIRGTVLSLAGKLEVVQRAPLPGLTISIRCTT